MATTVFQRTTSTATAHTHYCPGCTHGIIHRMVAEALDELGLRDRAVGIAPVGCSVLAYNYFTIDFQEAAHGRAPALATGLKRVRPELIVFTYQGDGDLASIGTAEIIHAANRGEKFCVFFVNNAIYGMTGGQLAPTTLPRQVTTTSPLGRDVNEVGQPLRVAEMLATLETPGYIVRTAVHTPAYMVQAKQCIKQAFQYQAEGRCFSLVEILSTCPTNWGLQPTEATVWVEQYMVPYYTIKEFKRPGMEG